MASKLDRLQKKGFKVNEAALSKIARGDQEPGGEYSEININDIEENPDNALYRELDTEEDIALLADDIRRQTDAVWLYLEDGNLEQQAAEQTEAFLAENNA